VTFEFIRVVPGFDPGKEYSHSREFPTFSKNSKKWKFYKQLFLVTIGNIFWYLYWFRLSIIHKVTCCTSVFYYCWDLWNQIQSSYKLQLIINLKIIMYINLNYNKNKNVLLFAISIYYIFIDYHNMVCKL